MILNSQFQSSRHPSGFSALLTVLILGVVSLTLAYSASILGLGEMEQGYTAQKGGEALFVADGCLEEALRRLRLNDGYTGSPDLSVGSNSCTITVTPNGSQRDIMVSGRSTEYYKKIRAIATVTGQPPSALNTITLDSWEERSD